jgi:beta-glucanase (GH16 family)
VAIPGYKVAWLLWPDSGTNTTHSIDGVGGNGEIDFPETKLTSLSTVSGYVHYQDATANDDQYAAEDVAVDMSQWHTYEIEWAPTYVAFIIDGQEIGRTTQRIPKTPMHWVWQTETEISSTPPPVDVAGAVEIDWAAIWTYAP